MQVQKAKQGYKLVKSFFGKYEEIPEGWEMLQLSKLCEKENDIVAGPFGSNLVVDDYIESGVPIIRLQNIDRNQFIEKNIKFISIEKAKELNYHSYQPSDLVLAKLGDPIGKTCRIPESFPSGIVVADVVRIRTSPKKSDRDFVEYVLNSWICTKQFDMERIGTTRPRVNLEQIRNLVFPCPPKTEQQKIASILSNVDSLINQTHKIIEQTQKLKKGLMQKLLTRGIGHTKFKKIKWLYGKEIEIPQSWNLTTLKEISTDGLQNGIFKKAEDFGFGVPLVNVSDLFSENEIRLQNLGKVNVSQKELAQFGIQEGDLFFCRSSLALDGIGRSNVIMKAETPAVFECHVMMLRPNNLVRPKYLFYFTRSHMFRQYIFSIAMTLTMTTIRQPDLEKAPILLPPIDEQQKILLILSDLDTTLEQLEKKVTQLELLKKGLMQKLLTGQMRVKV